MLYLVRLLILYLIVARLRPVPARAFIRRERTRPGRGPPIIDGPEQRGAGRQNPDSHERPGVCSPSVGPFAVHGTRLRSMDQRMKDVLAVLLADALIGGVPVPKAVGVVILRDDGVGYVWRNEGAERIAAIIGKEIIAGVVLPTPEVHENVLRKGSATVDLTVPKGETRH